MTFLNQALAIGAAAFLIPLVIHILNRRRFRAVEWGAMHLVESIIKVNQRWFQFEQWILLFVRCAITPGRTAGGRTRPVRPALVRGTAPPALAPRLRQRFEVDRPSLPAVQDAGSISSHGQRRSDSRSSTAMAETSSPNVPSRRPHAT